MADTDDSAYHRSLRWCMSISRREMLASVLGAGGTAVASQMTADGQSNQADLEAARKALEPRVLSGPELGFRVEGTARDGAPIGSLVVRIDGKWVATQFQSGVRRIS
jgi:hypothetical protein